jgi:hypothetical protein
MSFHFSPKIVNRGLIFHVDAANTKSFVSGTTGLRSITGNQAYDPVNLELINGVAYETQNLGSFSFDGSDDLIQKVPVSTGSAYQQIFPTIYSFNVWFKPLANVDSTTTGQAIIQFRRSFSDSENQADSSWFLNIGIGTIVVANEYITLASLSSTYRTCVNDGGSISNSQWNQLALNWNGSSYDVYLNGANKTTVTGGAGHVPLLTNPNCVYIGARVGDGTVTNNRYYGNISMVSAYDRSLTASEIKQNYEAMKKRYE